MRYGINNFYCNLLKVEITINVINVKLNFVIVVYFKF